VKIVRSATMRQGIVAFAVLAVVLPSSAAQAAAHRTMAPSPIARSQNERSFAVTRQARPLRVVANANPATYTDAAGDNGTAPDITSVVVSNDANNRLTFRINVDKLVVPSNTMIGIAIDSDQNRSTGSQGTDYLVIADLSNNSFGVVQWNGSTFVDAQAPDASASNDATGLTFSVNSADLGNTNGFNFWSRTLAGTTVAGGNHDDAPDQGTWNYQLGPATVLKLTAQLFHATKARSGKPFIAVVTVERSDGVEADVTPDDVTCRATIGRQPLRDGTAVALGPAVGCSWQLPKRSKGKTLHASITVNLDGASVTKTVTARIR
jgi:hypothetical protein